MNDEKSPRFRFKSFELDVAERQLLHSGESVSLTPKAFDVLAVLVERHGHLVEKEKLLQIVWADSYVEEANISRIIHTLRKTLGEYEEGNKFIETVAKKGYRFIAKVIEIGEPIILQPHNHQETSPKNFDSPIDITLPKDKAKSANPKVRLKLLTRPILVSIGFLTAIALVLLLSFNRRTDNSFNPNEVKSIAVLPLKSLTAENREPIYELGIAESIIYKLKGANNLIVLPVNTIQQYLDSQKDAISIGKEQKVDYVLASNYQLADGKIRVTSELIDVGDGSIVEVFRDEESISNSFAVQDAVTANIGQALIKKMNRESNNIAAKHETMNDEAYRLYLQGRALTDRRNRKDAEKAVEYLEKAIKLDPNYALAYAALANAHGAIYIQGGRSEERHLKQKTAIENALRIDPNLAEAYSRLGEMKMNYEWDFDGAEQAHKKAIQLNPNSAITHHMYSIYLNSMGRFDESISEVKTAINLEPASTLYHRTYGMVLYYARRYDEAEIQLGRTLEMDPSFYSTYGWLTDVYKMKGDNEKAFECFIDSLKARREDDKKNQLFKTIYSDSGWIGVNQQRIRETDPEEYWNLAVLYAENAEKNYALDYLEKGVATGHGWGWTTIKIDPKYDLLRSDPRFEALVKKVGLK